MAGKAGYTGISKADLTSLKSFSKPPALVKTELSATALLLGNSEEQAKDWRFVKSMIGNTECLNKLKAVDPEKVPKDAALKAKEMLKDVSAEKVKNVSQACHGIHMWNLNVIDAVLGNSDRTDT